MGDVTAIRGRPSVVSPKPTDCIANGKGEVRLVGQGSRAAGRGQGRFRLMIIQTLSRYARRESAKEAERFHTKAKLATQGTD